MITVNNVPIVNSAPILSAIGNKTAIKGNNLNFIVSATDIDNDSLTYSIINIPSGATFINKSFNWTPSSNQIGIYNITFTVSDGKLTDAEIITITVVDTAVVEIPQNQPLDGEPLLIKINEDNRVYRIIDNKKFWIPTAEVFNQMNYNWNNIKITDKITLDTYSRVKLTRAIGDVKVYYLTESGLKKWIQTETIFNSYGNKWEDVIEVSGVELTAIPNGFLIKLQNAPRVYKLENNQKRWIQTAETFNRLKYIYMKPEIIPTILVKTFEEVKERIKLVENYVDWVQLDIMDGVFVENLTWNNPEDLKDFKTKVKLEAHLMVKNPEKIIDSWLEVVDRIIVHYESSEKIQEIINKVHKNGKQIGVALNPETSIEVAKPFLNDLDLILLMSVQPGKGGQEFELEILEKIRNLRNIWPGGNIEVDGGVSDKNIKEIFNAGANLFCVGTYVYQSGDIKQVINKLKENYETI